MKKSAYCLTRTMAFTVMTFSVVAAQSLPEGGGSTDTAKYTIENCINKFSMDKVEKTKAGYQYWFADPNFADGKTLKMSVVSPPSATPPPHAHAEDEFFFVLEGKAEFYFQGKWTPAEPYTSFYCPSYAEHGIRNAGDTELKYLVIKQYDTSNPVRVEFMKKLERTKK
jgi:mannose-6-phosphate isomerase-like protein (cupin superfamily)